MLAKAALDKHLVAKVGLVAVAPAPDFQEEIGLARLEIHPEVAEVMLPRDVNFFS